MTMMTYQQTSNHQQHSTSAATANPLFNKEVKDEDDTALDLTSTLYVSDHDSSSSGGHSSSSTSSPSVVLSPGIDAAATSDVIVVSSDDDESEHTTSANSSINGKNDIKDRNTFVDEANSSNNNNDQVIVTGGKNMSPQTCIVSQEHETSLNASESAIAETETLETSSSVAFVCKRLSSRRDVTSYSVIQLEQSPSGSSHSSTTTDSNDCGDNDSTTMSVEYGDDKNDEMRGSNSRNIKSIDKNDVNNKLLKDNSSNNFIGSSLEETNNSYYDHDSCCQCSCHQDINELKDENEELLRDLQTVIKENEDLLEEQRLMSDVHNKLHKAHDELLRQYNSAVATTVEPRSSSTSVIDDSDSSSNTNHNQKSVNSMTSVSRRLSNESNQSSTQKALHNTERKNSTSPNKAKETELQYERIVSGLQRELRRRTKKHKEESQLMESTVNDLKQQIKDLQQMMDDALTRELITRNKLEKELIRTSNRSNYYPDTDLNDININKSTTVFVETMKVNEKEKKNDNERAVKGTSIKVNKSGVKAALSKTPSCSSFSIGSGTNKNKRVVLPARRISFPSSGAGATTTTTTDSYIQGTSDRCKSDEIIKTKELALNSEKTEEMQGTHLQQQQNQQQSTRKLFPRASRWIGSYLSPSSTTVTVGSSIDSPCETAGETVTPTVVVEKDESISEGNSKNLADVTVTDIAKKEQTQQDKKQQEHKNNDQEELVELWASVMGPSRGIDPVVVWNCSKGNNDITDP